MWKKLDTQGWKEEVEGPCVEESSAVFPEKSKNTTCPRGAPLPSRPLLPILLCLLSPVPFSSSPLPFLLPEVTASHSSALTGLHCSAAIVADGSSPGHPPSCCGIPRVWPGSGHLPSFQKQHSRGSEVCNLVMSLGLAHSEASV